MKNEKQKMRIVLYDDGQILLTIPNGKKIACFKKVVTGEGITLFDEVV